MHPFSNSRWIWLSEGEGPDSYAEFCDTLTCDSPCGMTLRVSADSDYALFVNGTYVASGQYGDYPHYKIYDELDLSPYLIAGDNRLEFLVYHLGSAGFSRYFPAEAGLLYEVVRGDVPVLSSREGIPSRLSHRYLSGRCVKISNQLGYSFAYDATASEGAYTPAVAVDKRCNLLPRPIPKHRVLDRKPMQSVRRLGDSHYLVDLGGETVGFPSLSLISSVSQEITVAWGEHLEDGCVRHKIHGRLFTFLYRAAAGENELTNYLLRLGCRYLELWADAPFELGYAGVLPQVYEVETLPVSIEGEGDRRIYEACLNTLRLCMMEHYVDCPWREQALYAFDSRNQMLCGYYAFRGGNAEYARSNLLLINEDRRSDGLLSICYPCGTDLAIPSFSLYYVLAVREYLVHTDDRETVARILPKLRGICERFLAQREQGLVSCFGGREYWNFYDWSPHSDGTLGRAEAARPDLAVNCLTVLALDALADVCRSLDVAFPLEGEADAVRAAARRAFLREGGRFSMHQDAEEYTVLGNSLAVLAGLAEGEDARALCRAMTAGGMVESSLSMRILLYDALLATDADTYRGHILAEIRRSYGHMLDAGSDTVWETALGACDFDGAGSLCHGWSAVPIYIFHRLGIAKYAEYTKNPAPNL